MYPFHCIEFLQYIFSWIIQYKYKLFKFYLEMEKF